MQNDDIRQTPATRSEHPGAKDSYIGTCENQRCKDIEKLPRLQRKVVELFRGGGRYSAADISVCLHLSDPRGHIARARRAGVPILDTWETSEYGTRYKVYFINGGQTL